MQRKGLRVALLAALALSACGITVGDAASQYGPPYCKKVQAWFPDSFMETYPGGLPQCEDQWTQGFSDQMAGASAGCSQSQLNNCVSAVNNLTEGQTLQSTPLPTACDVCAGATLQADGGSATPTSPPNG